MARPGLVLVLVSALPLAALCSSAEGVVADGAAALVADDECLASTDGPSPGCALNELQLKAKVQAQEETSTDDAENQTEAMAASRWYLGRVGESCTQACYSHRLACSPNELRMATNWQQVWSFAGQAGAKCTMSWANDNMHGMGFTAGVPAVCLQARCGSDLPGTCAYDATPRSTCDGLPATGFQRLCPCGASSGAAWGAHPAPAPYGWSVPAPAPHYPQSVPAPQNAGWPVPSPAPHPYSAPATPCDKDTGGTCSWLSCSKSRGTGASCVKSSGKNKCLCKAGYCAVKGVCQKEHHR